MTHTNGVASTGNLLRRGLRKLPDTWAAVLVAAAIFMAGGGTMAAVLQYTGLPARVSDLEATADSDYGRELYSGRLSRGVDSLRVKYREIDRKLDKLPGIERDMKDVRCILAGNRGPACR